MIDISVIIVNWNTRDILLECLDSIFLGGSRYTIEVIVVDNGSEDGSPEAVRSRFSSVKLIENGDNLGFAKANNIGICEAKGRYYCLINSDVKIKDGCFDQLGEFMDAHNDIGMVGPKIFKPNMEITDTCRKFPSLWTYLVMSLRLDLIFPKISLFNSEHLISFSHNELRDVDYLAGCFMMVRREVGNSVGTLDERFFIYQEEVDWCKRMKDAGWRITFFPKAEAVHYHGVSSSKDPLRFSNEQLKSVLKYWRKHSGFLKRNGVVALLIVHYGMRYLLDRFLHLWPPLRRGNMAFRLERNFSKLRILFRELGQS